MQQVAVVWQLYLLSRSPLALEMLGFLPHRPHHRSSALGGGVWRRAGPPAPDALHPGGLAMVSVALACWRNAQRTTPAAIYALAFVPGRRGLRDNPARQALVPRLVDRGQLPNALSLYATVWQVATIAGDRRSEARCSPGSGPTAIYLLERAFFWRGDRRAASR